MRPSGGRTDAPRLLVAIPVSRITAGPVLGHLRACNPTLNLDLALYTGGDHEPPAIDDAFLEGYGHVARLGGWRDLEALIPDAAFRGAMEEFFALQDRYALFRNTLLLYALVRGYDTIAFWDDDEYPIPHPDTESFFDHHLAAMAGGADVAIGHRYGHVNPVSADATHGVDLASLQELERALLGCIEVAYPGFLTERNPSFVAARTRGPAGPVVRRPKWVHGGNLVLRLRRALPPFFQPRGARGEDSFFGFQLDDYEVVRTGTGIFHDPFAEFDPISINVDWEALASAGHPPHLDPVGRFWTAVKGWIGYGPLKEHIGDRHAFQSRRGALRAHLSRVRGCPFDLVEQFDRRISALEADERDFHHVRRLWAELNDVHLPRMRDRRPPSPASEILPTRMEAGDA